MEFHPTAHTSEISIQIRVSGKSGNQKKTKRNSSAVWFKSLNQEANQMTLSILLFSASIEVRKNPSVTYLRRTYERSFRRSPFEPINQQVRTQSG